MFWPLGVYALFVVVLIGGTLVIAHNLGERHRERATGEPYESGMVPTGSARLRFPAAYYLVAMFFVIFDVETVFIAAWAVDVRGLGWPGYYELLVFVGVLLATLLYLVRSGAIDWRTERQRRDLRASRGGPR